MHRSFRFALAIGVALSASAGCAADDDSADTTTTTFASSPAVGAERRVIVDAYEDHWAPYYRYLNNSGGGVPIGNYFAGERRDDLPGQVGDYAGQGLEVRGEPDSDIRTVRVAGNRAVVTDCQIDGSYAVDSDTGDLVIPPSEVPQLVRAELIQDDSGWKVASVVYGQDSSCER